MDFHLNVHKALQVLVFLGGILGHQLRQGFALGVIGNDGPFTVNLGDFLYARNGQPGFLHPGDIQGLVEDIGLGVAFVEYLDGEFAVSINGLGSSDSDYLFQFHCKLLHYLP